MEDIEKFRSFSCPRWEALPEIELYMDQVLTLVSKHFGIFMSADGMTASMINNYVKASVVPSPKKKRYGKEHISRIFIICVLKRVLSISQIGALLELLQSDMDAEALYTLFCEKLDRSVRYISTILSGAEGSYPVESDKTGAELALQCAVDAFSNCDLADVVLGSTPKREEVPEEKQ